MVETVCPECNGHVVVSTGDYVCSSCGLVIEKYFQHPLEALDTNNPKSGGYLGERLHIIDGLGSYIDYHKSSKFSPLRGSRIPESRQILFRRLKKSHDIYGRFVNHQTEYRIFRILNQISSNLNLPSHVRDTAAYIYRKIKNKHQARITNHVAVIAVCIFLAIREQNHLTPFTLKEICGAFQRIGHRINERILTRTALSLRINLGYQVKIRRSEDYLSRLISEVSNSKTLGAKIPKEIEPKTYWQKLYLKALEILGKIPHIERGGRNPYVFAASIIYAAEQRLAYEQGRKPSLTQKEIAHLTSVAEYSIRDHYCSIIKNYELNSR